MPMKMKSFVIDAILVENLKHSENCIEISKAIRMIWIINMVVVGMYSLQILNKLPCCSLQCQNLLSLWNMFFVISLFLKVDKNKK